jgi:hypothetical protein
MATVHEIREAAEASLVTFIRLVALRDKLLAACDWTQVADASVDQAAWSTYRQALRDIPDQAGFPDNVTWPEKP